MIGEIYRIAKPAMAPHQITFGYPSIADGTLVLVTDDLGGGLFFVLSPDGKTLVSKDYLALCPLSLKLAN